MARNPTDETKLTTQQERFCQEYIVDHNGSAAAKRAQYSSDTAAEQSCRALKLPKIRDRIAELMDEQAERTQITADKILVELFKIATFDFSRNIDDAGEPLPIRFSDKIKALELLGKNQKLFTDKVDVSGTLKLEDLVAGVKEESK